MSWPIKTIRFCFSALFFIVPLIFLPSTSELFEFNKMIVVYIITTLIAGAWITESIVQQKPVFRRTSLDWPIIIFLASNLISLIFSIDQRTSLLGYYSRFNGGLASIVCYSLLYWAFVTFMNRKSALNIIAYCLLPTASLVCLYGILQHFGIDDQIWVQDVKNRVFSTLGQPNWLAAYIVALIFIPMSIISNVKNKTLSTAHIAISTVMFITLLFTKSRSGLLAFGISSVIYLFLNIKQYGFKYMKNYFVIGFWSLVIVFTLATPNPLRDLIIKTDTPLPTGPALETGGTESGEIRKIVWQGAISIWKSSPKNFWLGSGPETFAMAYYRHRPLAHNQTSEWELLYNKAHNEFLNYLAATGIVGLGSYLILLGTMSYQLLRLQSSNLEIALLAGWVTISITNFWGFSVVIINLLLFLIPAMIFSLNTNPRQTENLTKKQLNYSQITAIIISLLATSYLLFAISKYFLADIKYASGQKELKSFTTTQDPDFILSSYNNYLSAYNLNKKDPPIISDLATIMAYVSILTSDSDATASATLAQTSLSLSQKAIDLSPMHPNYYKSRSRLAIILATVDPAYFDIALQSLLTAQTISPTDPRIPYNLAGVLKYQKKYDQAKKYTEQALLLKPDFADALAQKNELASLSAAIK
jgi:O-antigen ligase